MSAQQNGASPESPSQVPLPPSPAQSVGVNESPFSRRTTSQPVDAVGKAEEKKGPTLEKSWEKLMAEVVKYDDEMARNWKEDIDTLLVFAGLFSAVITAFAIESYQWLSEDPADTTVMLLAQISMQLNASLIALPERPQFEPDASSIRINCFWFLSLIFSLTSALFGLLCKQWLREHQRDPPTRTPGEALALRQLRRDSLEKWGVPSFLSALPILLEVALLLFFVGILDLLWNRHRTPFVLCFIAVTSSAGLYFGTSFLPTLTVPGDQWRYIVSWKFNELSYQFICPYKSPQAWMMYRLSCRVIRPLLKIQSFNDLLRRWFPSLFDHIAEPASDWSSFDLRVIREFDRRPVVFSDSFHLEVYELRALEWAAGIFRDSPSIIPHLQNVLGTISPAATMSAVFGDWNSTMWRDVEKSDVDLRLRDLETFQARDWFVSLAPRPAIWDSALYSSGRIKPLFCHLYWLEMASRTDLSEDEVGYLVTSMESQQASLQRSTGLRFVLPFPVAEKLWTHPNPQVQEKSLRLLPFFKDAFSAHPLGYDEVRHNDERSAFVSALTTHLNRTDCTSCLLKSNQGHEFIRFVYDQVISRQLYEPPWDAVETRRLMSSLEMDSGDSTTVEG
ncbi:hypothetical protein Moror_1884 [Moniliophthora roreri MCA 2997]|uniref:DUF6535 domain-containing protein n=1 Tax=Moniliophthora roreri (strain MCA 2997) TaxID=1381753 RepID=V2X5G5_MONRO|nr:hypothetical protein Moror_1884 [Moniliophthora roreri MCA 2997]